MKTTRYLLEALVIAAGLMIMMLVVAAKPKPAELVAYAPWEPVVVSPSTDTLLYQEWEDNFDTTYVDDWGITHVTRKEYEKAR